MIIFYILNLFQGKTLHAEYIYDNRVRQKITVFEKGCILSFVLIIFIPFKNAFFIQADFLKYY